MSARSFAFVAISTAAGHAVGATMPAPKPDALAELQSTHQAGFSEFI
jgi:hypothetical protein